jgi:outer membrane protein OmpU
MKHTLLATTALVALTGAASAAELSISMTARVGLQSTEGTAEVAKNANVTFTKAAANAEVIIDALEVIYGGVAGSGLTDDIDNATLAVDADTVAEVEAIIANIEGRASLEASSASGAANPAVTTGITVAEQAALAFDLASAKAVLNEIAVGQSAKVAKTADSTDSKNRVRVSFTGSGETESGISYGATIRADNSVAGAAGTGGSQYVSGAFGKIKMGDLGGADKDAAGHIAGVGLTGLGDHNEIQYQAAGHNFGYEYSVSGLTFGYSQDTTVKSGSNSAMGVKYSGEVGGATVTLGLGQSKVGTATQSTMSAAVSTGGLTLKAISSSNDNGTVAAVTEIAAVQGSKAYVAGVTASNNADLDSTGVSVSYAMDSMTVTAFTMTESMVGKADADFSGFGFAYDMGGVSLKAGVLDNNDQQLIDFGLSFSF